MDPESGKEILGDTVLELTEVGWNEGGFEWVSEALGYVGGGVRGSGL